jgi:hypothetical protein
LGKTVDQLLSEISSEELSEWMAYYQLEPFGDERADWRSGMMAATMANLQRSKNRAPYKPEDFMPQYDRPEQEWEEQMDVIQLWHNALSGSNNG